MTTKYIRSIWSRVPKCGECGVPRIRWAKNKKVTSCMTSNGQQAKRELWAFVRVQSEYSGVQSIALFIQALSKMVVLEADAVLWASRNLLQVLHELGFAEQMRWGIFFFPPRKSARGAGCTRTRMYSCARPFLRAFYAIAGVGSGDGPGPMPN
jgi:hypothetical protein